VGWGWGGAGGGAGGGAVLAFISHRSWTLCRAASALTMVGKA